MATTYKKHVKKQNHKNREMRKYGRKIVEALAIESNKKDFWYPRFMEWAGKQKLWERVRIAFKIIFSKRKINESKKSDNRK